jgi:hypothetical protein
MQIIDFLAKIVPVIDGLTLEALQKCECFVVDPLCIEGTQGLDQIRRYRKGFIGSRERNLQIHKQA